MKYIFIIIEFLIYLININVLNNVEYTLYIIYNEHILTIVQLIIFRSIMHYIQCNHITL